MIDRIICTSCVRNGEKKNLQRWPKIALRETRDKYTYKVSASIGLLDVIF